VPAPDGLRTHMDQDIFEKYTISPKRGLNRNEWRLERPPVI
jgi:hypothetical protein